MNSMFRLYSVNESVYLSAINGDYIIQECMRDA